MIKRRSVVLCSAVLTACVGVTPAHAGQVDVTVFVGRAYPVHDERLTIRPSTPSLPGVQINVSGDPAIRPDGGLVLGAALAFEAGIVALEARVDGTQVGFDLSGARYDLRGFDGPLAGLAGSVTIGDGRFDAKRFYLVSGNVRVRTPGPIGVVASGGISVLPDVTITGSVPVSLQFGGIPLGVEPRLRLTVAPGDTGHRFGANAGAGLRVGGGRVALTGEVRAFFFRDYDLRFEAEGAPDIVVAPVAEIVDGIRFRPIIVNAQAGLVFRF
jgi:hypothetical protein